MQSRRCHGSSKPCRRRRHRGCLAALLAGLFFLGGMYLFKEHIREWSVDDTRFALEIIQAARAHGLDPLLVRAVVFQESRFDPRVRGGAGEVGLMQVLPSGAAAEWGRVFRRRPPTVRELEDVRTNLDVGCWYLARGMRRYGDHPDKAALALCFYNAGQGRADKWRPVDPGVRFMPDDIKIDSTRKYVAEILERYQDYREEPGKIYSSK